MFGKSWRLWYLLSAVRYLPKASRIPPLDPSTVGWRLGVGAKKFAWQYCTWIRARSVWMWESVGNKQWRGKTTKSFIAILLLLRLLIRSSLPPNMSSIISVLKTKLGEYMLTLPDGTAEYEDYEAWAVFDRSACGKDVPELADWIAKAEIGLDPMATDNWLVWGAQILPQRVVHVALQQQQAAEEQALAAEAEVARAAAAWELAEVDREQCWEVLVDAMFDGSLDPEEGEHQLAELEAESVIPLPLFLPSPSPSATVSSSHPDPSADSSQPDLSTANSTLMSATDALDQMSMGLSATAVVVKFARQPTPPLGHVVLPLGPGTGRMSTARSPVERNGAGKLLKDPPKLLLGDVLCARESKGCSFQPGWTPMDKGKGKGKSKEKGKSAPKLEERGRPLKRCKVEVVVPVRSIGDSIAQTKAAHTRKLVQWLPTTARATPAPTRPSCARSAAFPVPTNSSRLPPIVAQGIASELRYRIAVAEGTHASLARSVKMWQAELESLEVQAGPSPSSNVVLVEDLSAADDLGMSVSDDA
ncbi:hypothetical protein HETIRDRAFT_430832 [Heterobasidion irregulare TC 32-1]|uniref:Uncharacterized protein n=1 Tax=Heterobasidion irregulare (strain TC 32-1) TaxID=747525 RepID=W4JPM7_HETIT|nr:uncharacterized protein HETIRDRAFT_430832 [Heterobasidion irregulare TC 32-1]ETW75488.1 hypothetical protein HETIRDRAFT_430832 [Heterobasidion irregulare TC 32-1]